jgi:hypothetical protein
MEVSGQLHALAALSPGKDRTAFISRSDFSRCEKCDKFCERPIWINMHYYRVVFHVCELTDRSVCYVSLQAHGLPMLFASTGRHTHIWGLCITGLVMVRLGNPIHVDAVFWPCTRLWTARELDLKCLEVWLHIFVVLLCKDRPKAVGTPAMEMIQS